MSVRLVKLSGDQMNDEFEALAPVSADESGSADC